MVEEPSCQNRHTLGFIHRRLVNVIVVQLLSFLESTAETVSPAILKMKSEI